METAGQSVTISLFGSLAEAIGREVALPLEAGATVATIRRRLIALHPAAAATLARPAVRACLNDRIVDEDQTVSPGAELAFLPPLSGG